MRLTKLQFEVTMHTIGLVCLTLLNITTRLHVFRISSLIVKGSNAEYANNRTQRNFSNENNEKYIEIVDLTILPLSRKS